MHALHRALALALVVAMAAPTSARRLTCRDSGPNLVTRRGLVAAPFCNHDAPGDGICTFAICSACPFTRVCVGPESGVCPDGELPPGAEVVAVPVKKRHVRRIGTERVVFRCRPPAPCDIEHRCGTVTKACHDGLTGALEEGQCDIDGQVNGVCTFGFYCLEVCGGLVDTVSVPAGETRIILRGNLPRIDVTQYLLRCEA